MDSVHVCHVRPCFSSSLYFLGHNQMLCHCKPGARRAFLHSKPATCKATMWNEMRKHRTSHYILPHHWPKAIRRARINKATDNMMFPPANVAKLAGTRRGPCDLTNLQILQRRGIRRWRSRSGPRWGFQRAHQCRPGEPVVLDCISAGSIRALTIVPERPIARPSCCFGTM